MFLVIEVPGQMTDLAELTAHKVREVCRADTLPDLANALDAREVAECVARLAATGTRIDPGRPEVASPHMVRFRKGLDDAARAAGLEFDDEDEDEDDTPLAPTAGE